MLRLMISKLPRHLSVDKLREVPYCLPNCQDIPFTSLDESQPPAASPTIFLRHTPEEYFPRWTAYLQAVPLAALRGNCWNCDFHTVQARWCSGGTVHACSTGCGFESHPGHHSSVAKAMLMMLGSYTGESPPIVSGHTGACCSSCSQ